MATGTKKQSWMQIISFGVNLFLFIEVLVLIFQNRDLRSQLESATKRPEQLQQGEMVPAFRAVTLTGNPVSIAYQDSTKQYLFFLMSTTCSICEGNLANWNTLVESMHDTNTIVYGIALESPALMKEYFAKRTASFPVVVVADTSFSRTYKVYGFPQTLLINGKGKVIQTWPGTLVETRLKEVKEYLRSPTKS